MYDHFGPTATVRACLAGARFIPRAACAHAPIFSLFFQTSCIAITPKRSTRSARSAQGRLHPRRKLAPVPPGVPVGQSWHAVRDGVIARVCEILSADEGPTVAALTGRSGAGKTTAAAAMVGERGPVRPRAGETEDDARTRLDCMRALFPDGVVWLRVGKEEGGADRLPPLMRTLAKALHENVMEKRIEAPAAGEEGERYVKKIVFQESLRCLVVADDVWEVQVVEKLRMTGMWVLLTTREASIVEPSERVVVDELTQAEAEDVLRGAARLSRGEHLCDAAMGVLKLCGNVAMDIAFVGSWNSVCSTTDGVRMSSGAWGDVVRDITSQIEQVKGQTQVAIAGKVDDLHVERLAIFRAGLEYLGAESAFAQKLYVMLALVPHGHAFGISDAGVLLNCDGEVLKGAIAILERWAVLRADTCCRYRMHDAHVNFARIRLKDSGNVRNLAVQRWTSHISRLDVAMSVDLYVLLEMWRVLDWAGGEGWWASRPYDDQVVQMDVSSQSKRPAINFVAELYDHDQKFGDLESLMRHVLKHSDAHGGGHPDVQMTALHHIRQSLLSQGRVQESDNVTRRLGEMVGPNSQTPAQGCAPGFAQTATALHTYGVCAVAARRLGDAEEWFRKALKVEEDGGRTASSQTVSTLQELGRCVREAGRPEEARGLLKRALEIKEAKLGADHLHVAYSLHTMGVYGLEAGRLWEAEELFRRALEIKKAKLGANDVDVALTLHSLGLCLRLAGRMGEAEEFFREALEVKEAKLGGADYQVALTRFELSLCVEHSERSAETE